MTAVVVRGDALSLPLPDESVDLIVTSPPYWAMRAYVDDGEPYGGQVGAEPTPPEYLAALLAATVEMVRVLKPGGSIFVNLGDKYGRGSRTGVSGSRSKNGYADPGKVVKTGHAKSLLLLPERFRIAAVDQLGLICRAVIVWDKVNGLPESVADRVRRSHEDWVHLVHQPSYYAAVDEIREPYHPDTAKRYAAGFNARTIDAERLSTNTKLSGVTFGENPLGKLPGSVWPMPSAPLVVPDHLGVDHFAAFPPEWPRRLITGWCPPGGVVLDPFGGTGTTAMVADCLGRIGISADLSHDYCRLARWRTTDPAQRAKVLGVAKPPVQTAGQASLYDDDLVDAG